MQFPTAARALLVCGKLIELSWALELVALPGKDAAPADFVLAPDGRAVTLETERAYDVQSDVSGWVQEALNPKKPSSIQSGDPFETSTSNRQ